jgi:hypothetical protein
LLASGKEVTVGLLIDFLADSRKSAREGLPVYHMGGGAGYIWAADYDNGGTGRLRLTSVDPTLLNPSDVAQESAQRPIAPDAMTAEAYAPVSADPAFDRSGSNSQVAQESAAPSAVSSPTPTVDPADVERDRAAKIAHAVSAAKAQLEDVGGFIKAHPQSERLLEYIDRMGALSNAVKLGDAAGIEKKMTELTNALSHDREYQSHQADLARAEQRKAAQYLGDAIRRGGQQRDFLMANISQNPLADST